MIAGDAGAFAISDFGPEAIEHADTAVKLSPDVANVFFTRGQIYHMIFRNKWQVYQRSQTSDQKNLLLKVVGLDVNHIRKAIADYKRAIGINPKFCEAYKELNGESW